MLNLTVTRALAMTNPNPWR